MPIDQMPWVIVDFKRESAIARIPYLQEIPIGEIPTRPGVFVVRPFPTQETEMEEYFMQIWDAEGIGLYIDEGVMVANNAALDAILIQGRSKQIPVIMLSQRPVGISRFAFSESQYFVVFPNHDKRERKTISEFTPIFPTSASLDEIMLPRYHSYYYEVTGNRVTKLAPVPDITTILATFERKLRPSPEPDVVSIGTQKSDADPMQIKYVPI
jgi:hypothetical protein